MRRLRWGEWSAGVGAAGLLATSFLPWFGVRPSSVSSSPWEWLGWFTLAVAVMVFAAGAWLFVATVVDRPVAQQVGAGVLAAVIGTLGFAVLALRVLVFQPGPTS